MKWRKRLQIGAAIVLSLLLISDMIAGNYFYNLAIKREQKDFLQGNEDLTVSASAMDVFIEGSWRDWMSKQEFETWEMQSYDDLNLTGYFLEAEEPTNKAVIFAHGYLGKAKDMGLYARYYYEELGYHIFMADMRGHGDSEGEYIGFGWHDRFDYLDWTDKVIDKVGENAEVVLHGLSMGAATVLMTSGEDHPENVKAIVADSAYTSVYDMFQYQMNRMYNMPSFPILPTTNLITKVRAGYSLKEASALNQVKNARVPVLYFHGKEDTFVPTDMAMELKNHTETETDMLLFDQAGHGEAYAINPEPYEKKLTEFLQQHVGQ
ncbi:alpha/beta hydrolase [Gracilibacillus sp. YIM 98692]|uniref:alpha/beta hydrolase n=1 Tax=Gracilibacillus sp. YIM 98692 TaxID=2663532 RepID=UPI0013D68903|nr:alpha/beta hydrolase [Gracilibacillus sp. YIM 98692]